MKDSISNKKKKTTISIISIFFWIIIWQLLSSHISNNLLIVSPLTVLKTLLQLMQSKEFYISVLNSFNKIIAGFLTGCILGIVLSILSYRFKIVEELLKPMIYIIKSTPVASFIILALVWIKSADLSVFISFLMVLPPIYTNMLKGLYNTDKKMLEMSFVFKVNIYKKIRYIYIPSIKPYLVSAVSVALGFCWKAGVAAEVISLPQNSLGEALYKAKIYLNTPELFALTAFIILISVAFEALFISLMKKI